MNQHRSVFSVVLLVVALVAGTSHAQTSATLTFMSPTLDVGTSGVIEAQLDCGDVQCGLFALTLHFDPTILHVDRVEFGTYLGDPALGQVFIAANQVDNTTGVVELAATSVGSPSPSADNVLFRLHVTGLADGQSYWTYSRAEFGDIEANILVPFVHIVNTIVVEDAASSAGGATITVAADGSVVIGLAAGLSGEGIGSLGIDIQRGVELALEDRPMVTVDGEEFAVMLDVQDDLCSADGGPAVANRFSADTGVIGVVGPMCSSACRAAAPIFDAAGFTTISPSCTAPDLTASGFSSFNRAVVSDAFQGKVAADYIFFVLDITSIATIHDGSPYGEGLVNVVQERFTELGGEVVASDAVSVSDTDFRALLDDIAQMGPELIYFGGFPAEAARLIEQRADAGLEATPFMGADGIRGTEVIELSGESSEDVYATSAIPSSGEELTSFLERYEEAYGEAPPAPYHANAYDAVNLFLDAVEATGTVEDGTLTIDRAAVADYIRSVSDFQGLTGVINAEGNGEMSVADIGIYQVQDGEFVLTHIGSVVIDDDGAFTIFD